MEGEGARPKRRKSLLIALVTVVALVVLIAAFGPTMLAPRPPENRSPLASFVVSPASGDTSTLFRFDASGSSDPEDGTARLEVRWDWEGDGAWDTGWSTQKLSIHTFTTAGTYAARLEVQDSGGRVNGSSRSIAVSYRDDIAPAVSILSPMEGEIITTIPVHIDGTATDDVAVFSVELSADGLTWVTASGSSSWSGTLTLAPGPRTIRARAMDAAGNVGMDSVNVSVADTTAPVVTIANPTEGAVLQVADITVTGTARDDVAVVIVELSGDGLTWVAAAGTTSWSATLTLSPGLRLIRARATDAAGNVGPDVVNVTVSDTTAPEVAITYPADGDVVDVVNIPMTGTAHDDVAVSLVEVSLDGLAWTPATGTASWHANVTLAKGMNLVRARATDSSGNTGYATANVTLGPPAELRLGVILSLTGVLEMFGKPAERAIRMAVEEINADGGVFGRPINLSVEDDQTSPTVAATAAARLIAWEADAIVGTLASSGCRAILDVARANGVFQVSGACSSPIFSDPAVTEGWFARTHPSDALQGAVGAHHAYHARGFRTVGVMASDHAYGRGVANAFTENFTRHGGTISALQIVPEGAFDYTAELSAIMATSPDAIYLAAYIFDAVTILRQWYANNGWWGVAWLFPDGVLHQSFIDNLIADGIPASVVRTFQGTAPGSYLGQWGPRYAEWSASYEARWGLLPAPFDAPFYDAVYLVALAAEASGLDSRDGVRSSLWAVANPPGVEVGPGEWSLALSTLTGGGEVSYNGSANFVDLQLTGDVTAAMVIWGIDATNRIVVNIVHDEASVRAMLP